MADEARETNQTWQRIAEFDPDAEITQTSLGVVRSQASTAQITQTPLGVVRSQSATAEITQTCLAIVRRRRGSAGQIFSFIGS